MIYTEHTPHPSLRPFVRCIWELRGAAAVGGTERVLPDGCAEIIVNRADRFRRLADDDGSRLQAEVLVVGQISRRIRIRPEGVIDLLGVRFEPAGLGAVLGIPMHELTDHDLCLGQLSERLRERFGRAAAASADGGPMAAVEAELWRELSARGSSADTVLGVAAEAVRRIDPDAGTTAEAMAASVRVSRRTLERAFRDEVGLSPKLYLRIHRFAGVIRCLGEGRPPGGWATVAAAHGFADQSHLIRDFRLLAGITPERYLREQSALTDLFSTPPLSRSSNT